MHDPVTSDPDTRRTAYVVWIAAAVAGTAAVWWLSSYVDSLAVLARSDPEASFRLFRTRVLPALAVIVIVAIGAGAWLARYGKEFADETGGEDRWPVWDEALIAVLLGLSQDRSRPRPKLNSDATFAFPNRTSSAPFKWVISIDRKSLFGHLRRHLN